ncbi:Uncharacterised protein [Serratia marcescens]|uniref:Uncharacterized protein n=1 Tax=Serratia marcescens TaxID=615 RepID=A0A380A3C5_SERMA|nr:Uncharacterised protein [Serratia marcescens]
MRPIWMRARSWRTASRRRFSTSRWWRTGVMSMKSMTIRPPRSRRRSWRAISSAASRLVVERRLFDVAAAGCTRGVDVDGGQRFGAVDDDRAAGRQAHFALEGGFDLRFDLIVAEQRNFTAVQFDFAAEIRAASAAMCSLARSRIFGLSIRIFADVRAQVIAEGAHDNVAFLVDQERRRAAFGGFFNRFPSASGGRRDPTAARRRICLRPRCERSGPCRPAVAAKRALLSGSVRSSPSMRREIPPARGLFGISTR